MPRKPTQTFGTLNFSKDGRVTPELTRLSDKKEDQQDQAMQRFIETFNTAFPGRTISDLRPLPENDFDFEAKVSEVLTDIELTELVDRDFTFQMSPEEYNAAKWQEAVQKEFGAQPWRVDIEKRDEALKARIAHKAMAYSRARVRPRWLVVFATFMYDAEFVSAGQLVVSEGLSRARAYVGGLDPQPFDEVWFTNLMTRPACVWPPDRAART